MSGEVAVSVELWWFKLERWRFQWRYGGLRWIGGGFGGGVVAMVAKWWWPWWQSGVSHGDHGVRAEKG